MADLTLDQILAAIRQHESGGNYTAKNPYGSASGAYQFIDSTWRSVLGQIAPQLVGTYPTAASAPPALQDQAARHMAQGAFQRYGTLAAVPAVWYVGHYNPNNLNYVPSPESGNKKTVAQFISDIYGIAGGQPPEFVAGAGGSVGGDSVTPRATDDEYQREIDERFGAFSWLMNDPHVGPLLREGFAGGISWAEFQSRLQQTPWWRSHSESQRKWDAMYSTDPAEAARQVNQRRADMLRTASTYGVTLSQDRASLLAFQSLRFGWRDEDVQRAILAEQKYQRRQEGVIGSTQTQIKQLAAEFGINAPDKRAFKFAKQILSGEQTLEGLRERYRNQARALFPAFRDEIDNGATVADIAAPYVDQASRLLEVGTEQIDLTDPKFQRALTHRRPDGKAAPLSLSEWSEMLMKDDRYGWEKTANARDSAYGLVRQLAARMGSYA
jgi:hypothetical protein